MPTRTVIGKVVAALAAAVVLGACSGSPQPRTITLTLIRHAQSENNLTDTFDTTVPGPGLTAEGVEQAAQLADELKSNQYDGVYASTMLRTQQTAAPLAKELGRQVQVLPGLQEVDGGWFNGKPGWIADAAWIAPEGWIAGDHTLTIPGSVSGTTFNDEFTAAVRKIYDNRDHKPVVFSHGMAIMAWTLMNVTNPRDELMTDHRLPNIGRVVVTGNPDTGWKLVDWDGVAFR